MDKRIAIVGEAFGEKEEKLGRPFVGPSGKLLNTFLSAAGIARAECHLTNVFNFHPVRNDIRSLTSGQASRIPGMPKHPRGWIHHKYKCEIDRLFSELDSLKPNAIIALGATATWALLHDSRITKLRGYQYTSVRGGWKVIPTFHPASVLRQFQQRPIVLSDLNKARREAEFPEVRRPPRELWLEPNLLDLEAFEQYILNAEYITVDVETEARQITCIGFSPSPTRAIVIPFVDRRKEGNSYWPTQAEEVQAWTCVKRWLASPVPKVNQNISYDLRYLWEIYGIPINNIIGDTMLRNHALQPEMPKSLAFLGSIYSYEPSWKSLRKDVKTLKKEDD